MSRIKTSRLGSPEVIRLLVRLTVYYGVLFGGIILFVALFPGAKDFLPFGGAALIPGSGGINDLTHPSPFYALNGNSVQASFRLFSAIIGVLLVMLPVTWVYFKIRLTSKLDQSLVQTMLLLPVAVAGVVAIVQNSLALAFSLAGIVAAIRFRNTLKNTGDSLFILTAIGAGLAAGVRSLEIAIVVTVVFNYIFLILWDLDYGAEGAEKFMNPSSPLQRRKRAHPARKRKPPIKRKPPPKRPR